MPEEIKSTFDTIMGSLEGIDSGDDGGEAGGNGSESGDPEEGVNGGDEGDGEEDPGGEEEGGDDDGPAARNDAEGEEEGDGEEEEEEPVVEDPAIVDATAAAKGQDEFDKLLDEFGFRAPKPGQKENRIPQSRVRARVKTALKKHAARFEAERTTLQGQVAQHAPRLEAADRVEALINQGARSVADARSYVEVLAKVHPVFGELLKTVGGGAAAPSEALTKLGAMPRPDVDYGDGSFGYSDAQMAKRDQWLMDKAAIQTEERMQGVINSRLTPIEQERANREREAKEAPVRMARLESLRKTWGPHFVEDEKKGAAGSEILKYQKQHNTTFIDAVAAVIIPKMMADRTKMRQEILKELKGKKAKAGKVVSQSSSSARRPAEDDGPRTTGSTILAALEKAGL
jgi:hypothetical protein